MAKWILNTTELSLAFGERQLLQTERLTVYEGDRIGLIGENGAGKTTLLRILAGELTADSGMVRCLVPSAMIHQQGNAEPGEDRQMTALFQAQGIRTGLSGGEMTRNRIAGALASGARLLMADEPTTDLDEEGQRLLRKQLDGFDGSIILISHDRMLLQDLCTRIWYLEDGKITDFPGGYEGFMAERTRQRERAAFEYDQYRTEQKRLKEAAQHMAERVSQIKKAPSRMGNSEARLHKREWTDSVLQVSHAKRILQNRMEHMEVKEKPRALPEIKMKLGVLHPVESRNALEFRCDRMAVEDRVLLENTGFVLPTGSRTALTGPNGCGKTTLLRILTGQPDAEISWRGRVQPNPKLRLGWFDQHHERTLNPDQSILENVMRESAYPESFARTVLACLGLSGESVFKPVRELSGGEKAKTALGKLLLMDCNTLLLDEPTNHLDLFTMEELEKLLSGYGGTLLFVSHDRMFLRKIATRTVRFDHGKLMTFEESPDEAERGEVRNPEKESRQIEISRLEMQMAVLSARMSAPKKGDRPDALQEEYMRLAADLRQLKTK